MNSRFIVLIPFLLIGACSSEDITVLISSIFNLNASNPEDEIDAIIDEVFAITTQRPTTTTQRPILHSFVPCGAGKECVRQYLCSDGKINKEGNTVIDIRIDEVNCPFLETCCSINDTVAVTEPIVRPVDPPSGCGYRNIEGVGFKIQGANSEAEFGEFPWMMAILREEMELDKVLNVYQCGGSLITPSVVLTGAHCVQARKASDFKVRAGEWETNMETEIYPHQDRQVIEMIVHEEYNKGSLYNDIALLFLDTPFDDVPNVQTVCLPPAGHNFDTSHCIATGWGKDQFQNGQYQNILKKIDLPIVPNAKCQENLRKTRLSKYFELHPSFMCAGGERDKDTCKGDGGSPLVCPMPNDPNRYFQAGIVAWGIGCGEENVPGVYGNVPYLRPWIDEQLRKKGVDAAPFTA